MNRRTLSCLLLLVAAPLAARADQLVPAGTVIQCTVSEKVSSKTVAVGDPVLCTLGHQELYGRTSFPYGTYIEGHFAEYKDPGHFVGKGWMVLDFDRLYVQPDTIVPIHARVVSAPKYPVDQQGRIHGTGHATRDTIEWFIPVLWPIDLINLPRRGPRPELKPESRLTLKVLDDFGIPTPQENAVRTPALISRQTPDEPTYQRYREQAAPVERYAPVQQGYQQQYQQPVYQPQAMYQQPVYAPQPQVVVQYVQQPAVIVQQAAPVIVQQQAPVIVQQPSPYVVNNYPPPPPGRIYAHGGPYGRYYPY